MKIHKLTFTGADNETDIAEMVKLCKEYPFIEFGILTKTKFWGESLSLNDPIFWKERYPSVKWIQKLVGAFTVENLNKHLSLHVCPPLSYELMKDLDSINQFGGFGRIQLNSKPELLHIENIGLNNKQIIVQLNGEAAFSMFESLIEGYNRTCYYYKFKPKPEDIPIVGLHDMSGGRGILAKEWPQSKITDYPSLVGYAGGLNPDNLKENIEKIFETSGDNKVWLDMESGVRTDGRFDLDKVVVCCKIVREYEHDN